MVPVYEAYGEPIPSKGNQVEQLPTYINSYVARATEGNRTKALDAAKEP